MKKEDYLQFARGRSAQAWCTESTKSIVMDTDLAEAFANILAEELHKCSLCNVSDEDLLKELEDRRLNNSGNLLNIIDYSGFPTYS